MVRLMRFPRAVKHDQAIEVWMHEHSGELGAIAQVWFEALRACGDDVRELLHDGHPSACVNAGALMKLIEAAYADMKRCLAALQKSGGKMDTQADFSHIFAIGEYEISELPETSTFAERFNCSARVCRDDVVDTEAGKT
jgi:hypothetical protein